MEHVLLTGFPGFLAENLIRRCRQDGVQAFWHLLVLPDEIGAAVERLGRMGLTEADYAVHSGDITRPDMSLTRQDADRLSQTIERCFHLAALYDLTASAATSQAVNVRGTRWVLEFLKRCPKLKKLNYVSTCYVSGTLAGPIHEDALPEPPSFRNEYERTKYEAERLVREAFADVPTTIYRPAVVVGDSRTGETAKFDGPYVLTSLFTWARPLLRWMPNLGFDSTWFNCVPVDFVTSVLVTVGFSEDFVGKTLQIADPDPPTTAESFDALFYQTTGRNCFRVGNGFKRFTHRALRRFPLDLISGISAQALDYFDHRGLFQTDNTREACRQFGIEIPKRQEFYKSIVKFARTHRRPAPNAGVVREFKGWCLAFRAIYAITGLVFLLAPGLVTRLLTALDGPQRATLLTADNLLWRPLGVSLIVALLVAVTFLERDPFQKPLHILIVMAKATSTILFLACAIWFSAVSLLVCAIIDGVIGTFHLLFYHRLSRIRVMYGGRFLWSPFDLAFPRRFLEGYVATMLPELDDPVDFSVVVEEIREDVRGLPVHIRCIFLTFCYMIYLVLPCAFGYRPFLLMDHERRCRFLVRVEHVRSTWVKFPLLLVKLISSPYVYRQESYLRSIGAA
jgi:thioester reductase-like protein